MLSIVIEKGIASLNYERHLKTIYNMDLYILMLSSRVLTILYDNNYQKIRDVINEDLTHLKGIGPATNELIQERIRRLLLGKSIY